MSDFSEHCRFVWDQHRRDQASGVRWRLFEDDQDLVVTTEWAFRMMDEELSSGDGEHRSFMVITPYDPHMICHLYVTMCKPDYVVLTTGVPRVIHGSGRVDFVWRKDAFDPCCGTRQTAIFLHEYTGWDYDDMIDGLKITRDATRVRLFGVQKEGQI